MQASAEVLRIVQDAGQDDLERYATMLEDESQYWGAALLRRLKPYATKV
jgi:hypothetical protein